MATSNGSSGDDIITGTSGADTLNGGAGSDILDGGAGSDRLSGGSGSDTLDGGSGSDLLNGDSGNDILVYRLAENAGSGDLYTGGSGVDTVRVMLTSAEWLKDSVQSELARYFTHLSTVQRNASGEVSNGASRDFTFNFGTSTLTVQMMERLEVYVDGQIVGNLDAPIVDVADSTMGSAVVEDGSDDASPTTAEIGSGSIKFFDLDVSDTHSVSVLPPAGALLGAFNASLTNAATGDGQGMVTWTYTLNDSTAQALAAGETRTEVYTVRIMDNEGVAVTQNVTITIHGTNDAPVAVADVASANEDGAVFTGSVAVNDSDVDHGAVLSYTLDAPAPAGLTFNSNGSYSFDASHAAYQHLAAGATQDVVVGYTVTDQHGASSSSTLTITVTGTNDAPVAAADVNSATEDGAALTGTVATNDGDIDNGSMLSYSLNAPAPVGLTFNSDGSYSFDASHSAYQHLAAGATEDVVVGYTITDQHGASSSSTLTITMTGTNDAPVAAADAGGAIEDGTVLSGSVAVNDSDVDHDAVLSYTLDAPAPAGLTFNSNGSYSFDASHAAYQHLAVGATQDVIVGYTVTDQHGASSSSTLTITVTGTNDAPVAVADVSSATEDGAVLTGTVATNDSDIDNESMLSYSLNAPAPAGLTFNSDGSYSFDPSHSAYQHLAAGATQDIIVGYTVTDQQGASSSSTLTITVTGTNDAPVAVADVGSATEDGAVLTGTVATNDGDIDGGATLSYVLDAAAPAGLIFNNNGSYSFDPAHTAYQHLAAGATQDVIVGYTVTDQFGANSNATLTITVTGTNDAPVNAVPAAPVTTDQGSAKVITGLSISDIDAGSSNVTITLSVTHGTLAMSGGAGVTATGSGTSSVTLTGTVTAINTLLASANATTYTPTANYTGSDTLTVVTNDGGNGGAGPALTDTDTVAIVVNATNEAPVAALDVLYVSNNTNLITIPVSALLGNDRDADGPALTIASVGSASGGVSNLVLNSNGTITFSSSNASSGSFTYTVADSGTPLGTSTATVTVNIVSTNGSSNVDLTGLTYDASYLDGGSNSDRLTGGGVATDTFIGGIADDTLVGGNGDDVLRGGAGNDTIDGGAGVDLLDLSDATAGITITLNQGANGANSWSSGALAGIGTDAYKNVEGVIGSAFSDMITGSGGNDILRGGAGNDSLNGGAGIDLLDFSEIATGFSLSLGAGGSGTAGVNGMDSYSNIEGVIGGNGNDTITGNSSNNVLYGGEGNDALNGGAGVDVLIGGAGIDTLTGGAGSDTYRFLGEDARSVDTITDFNTAAQGAGGDVLDISDLLLGAPAINSGNVADYLSIRESGGNSIVSIDRDGAGSAYGFEDLAVLSGITGLSLASLLTNNNIDTTV